MRKASVLIPCYNAEQWIHQAIQSALNQSIEDMEVIVVDDGSTDGSLKQIQSFGDRIRWETGPNRGGNVARNRLLELSSGQWLQYLDADDYLLEDKIERQLTEARPDDVDVLWSPSVFEFVGQGESPRTEEQVLEEQDPWVALVRWNLPQTGASLWRRQAIVDAGGWKPDQPCCQEHELYCRLLKNEAKFQFCPSARSVYRQWSEETVCRKNPMQTWERRVDVICDAAKHLQATSQFDDARRQSTAAALVECARATYRDHTDFAVSTAKRAHELCGSTHLPVEPVFPTSYRFLHRLLGFRAAETVASLARRVRGNSPA